MDVAKERMSKLRSNKRTRVTKIRKAKNSKRVSVFTNLAIQRELLIGMSNGHIQSYYLQSPITIRSVGCTGIDLVGYVVVMDRRLWVVLYLGYGGIVP